MKIYLAGCEQSDSFQITKRGIVENAFYSYYHIRNKNMNTLIEGRKHIKNIIIDSGAHTFFSEADNGLAVSGHKKKSKTVETPFEYFSKYKAWIKQYYEYFDYYVELDIGEIVGQQTILGWREQLKSEGLYDKCITCYHPNIMTRTDFVAMLKDSQSRYIGIEGIRPGRPMIDYSSLISKAYSEGVKVHGFAMVKKDIMERFPFYSVDSSSWKAGNMYGIGYVKKGNGTVAIKFNYKPKEILYLINQTENITEAFSRDNKLLQRNKIMELAVYGYAELQKYYTEYWERKGVKW